MFRDIWCGVLGCFPEHFGGLGRLVLALAIVAEGCSDLRWSAAGLLLSACVRGWRPVRFRGRCVTPAHTVPSARRNPAVMVDVTGDGSADLVLMDPQRRGRFSEVMKVNNGNVRAGRARDFCEASESQVWIHLSHCISLQHR